MFSWYIDCTGKFVLSLARYIVILFSVCIACACVCKCAYMRECICECVCLWVCLCVCVCVCVCIRVYKNIYTHSCVLILHINACFAGRHQHMLSRSIVNQTYCDTLL